MKQIDERKQRIFIALSGRSTADLDEIAALANASRQMVARELRRIGWVKRARGYVSPLFVEMEQRAWGAPTVRVKRTARPTGRPERSARRKPSGADAPRPAFEGESK